MTRKRTYTFYGKDDNGNLYPIQVIHRSKPKAEKQARRKCKAKGWQFHDA